MATALENDQELSGVFLSVVRTMSMGSAAAVKRDGLDIAAEARGADRIRPQYGRRVAALPFAVGLTDVSLLRRCAESFSKVIAELQRRHSRGQGRTAHKAVRFDRYGGVGRARDTKGCSPGGRADLDDGNPGAPGALVKCAGRGEASRYKPGRS